MRRRVILAALMVTAFVGCGGDDKPTPPTPPTGPCCALNGSCTVTIQADCSRAWTQAGTCDPNPCPQPPPGMIWIPAGNVRLGQADVPGARPVNDVYVEGFWIDRYEVTNARYKQFIDAGGYTTEACWRPGGWAWRAAEHLTVPYAWSDPGAHGGGIAGNEQFPVNSVSWWEADAFCRWAGMRLPTEAEWEKAAKGGCELHGDPGQCDASDTPTYPWGEDISDQRANSWESGDPFEYNGFTTPVGYYDGSNHGGYQTIDSPSPYGLYDVVGNVEELCSTRWVSYPYNPADGREDPPTASDDIRWVTRGGSFAYPDTSNSIRLRCAHRGYAAVVSFDGYVGFRCARNP